MRIVLGCEYDGSCFSGFQNQPNVRTVQAVLETALSQIANEPIQIYCAGRTDAGVHAINQVVHFDTTAKRNDRAWVAGTNSLLPCDVVIKWVKVVDEEFHARFSALSRFYRYVISNQNTRIAIFRNYVTHWPFLLNEDRMQTAVQYLLGEHDFASFRCADCQAKTTIRRIEYVSVKRENHFVLVDIIANAFLHHMVRNIVGVLLEIGMKRRELVWMKEIMETCTRNNQFITAPPQGLYLMDVYYPKKFQL